MGEYILTLSCSDRPGLVADVAGRIASSGGNIMEAAQFDDVDTGRFFMRLRFHLDASAKHTFREKFSDQADTDDMNWALRSADLRRRTLILVSNLDHCLGDLLYRQRLGELPMEVVGIVSNHPRDAFRSLELVNVPFHYLPVTRETKGSQEAQIRSLVESAGAELVILARYMQILSDELAAFLAGRCINIHHSFLPGFKGARPYHQAHVRGVKMIGATAHYITAELDEGPIIHQDVESITHADSPADLIRKGRDIERTVLARAVQLHLEDRVLLNGTKTVVFNK
jgi:formyltetrahydrofolate deformylase